MGGNQKQPKALSPFEQKLNDWFSDHLTRVPAMDKMLFVHHLQIMIKAGLSILAAFKILSEEIQNKKLRRIVGEVKSEVEKGKQLSEALSKYPKIFPSIYVSMIAAGESSGKMEEALEQIHQQMKKNNELTSRIRGALIYPAVVLTAIAGIAVEMVFFVLPKIMVMFEEMNAVLPLPTRILIKVVNFGTLLSTTYWGPVAIAAVVLFIITARALYRQPSIKRFAHNLYLRIPIFGSIVKKINLARFTSTLSSLLNSAIPIIDATRISSDVLNNIIYRENLIAASDSLKKGEQLSALLAKSPLTFPPMVTEMIKVGEETGEMEKMLSELSEYYSNEVDYTMKNFSTIIEPVLILTLGLAVGGIAVSVIMPMYSLAESF